MSELARLPRPDDFAPAPTVADHRRWEEADVAALPKRLAALRARMAEEGVDALLLTSHADARYFTGMRFGPNEEPTAGSSGARCAIGGVRTGSVPRTRLTHQTPMPAIAPAGSNVASPLPAPACRARSCSMTS